VSSTYDYVIVGGGSAGCVLANRLSADSKRRVLLIEAGPRDLSPYIHFPVGLMKLDGMHWGYEDEPDPSRFGQTMTWMAGKVLGGGSSVNGMVWVRGNPVDFDTWESMGCPGWGWDDVLPYFKKAEKFEGGETEFRGGDGPQHVGYQRSPHKLTDAFIEAAQAAGLKFNPDYNAAEQEGVAVCQTAQRRGFRHSEARAYLGPTKLRRNLRVVTDAFVTTVDFEGIRAVGVTYEHKGETVKVRAAREVIISAGALATPKVLMVSGVGPAEHLGEHGVDVVADVPGVGHNLQEHPIATMIWNTNESTFNMELTAKGMLRHGLDFVIRGKGAAASTAGHAVVFTHVSDDAEWPEVEMLFAPFGMVGAGAGDTDAEVLESAGEHDVTQMEMLRRPSVTLIVQNIHPRSRGRIELRSSDPHDKPVIRHTLLGDPKDIEILTAATRLARTIMASEPIKQYVTVEALPGAAVNTDQEWAGFFGFAGWGAQHPVGTCKMGNDDLAVVDERLRVRGVQALRVVDASVMPVLTSGNTNAPTVMIAEKAADMILEDAR